MGVRFAKVEFCAAIAALLKGYWVELGDGDGEKGVKKAEEQLQRGLGLEMGLKLREPLASRSGKRYSEETSILGYTNYRAVPDQAHY
jgi:hypothetical protein